MRKELKKITVWAVLQHRNEMLQKPLCVHETTNLFITNGHCHVLRSRSHNKLGTTVRE